MIAKHLILACLMVFTLAGPQAEAGPVLDRVRSSGHVRCGAAERPGLAEANGNGAGRGLLVDVCRAVAQAVLGAPDPVLFSLYDSPKNFSRAGTEDDLSFLSGSEIQANQLAGRVIPGPAVFFESHALLVPGESPAQKITDLAGKKICVLIGSRAERSLSHVFERAGLIWLPVSFSEDGEMLDAFWAHMCDALALEQTAAAALSVGRNARLLEDRSAYFPILAVSGKQDGEWAALVAWTVTTLISGERPETPWYAGGAGAMPLAAPELGLGDRWQSKLITTTGDYGAIYDRNLGWGSALRLARGLNAAPSAGGALAAAYLE